jgi:hypothetical protein
VEEPNPKTIAIQKTTLLGVTLVLSLSLSCRLFVPEPAAPEAPSLILTTPTSEAASPILATATVEAPDPSPTATVITPEPTATLAFVAPAGFKEYRDPLAGVSVYIPEGWFVTDVIEGKYAILQSYPPDKYVGGEAFQPGDAKCDLSFRPPGTSAEEVLQDTKSDSMATIISEERITLDSGQPAVQVELESMGRAKLVVTEINGRALVLVCFNDFTRFDEIAATLRASE